VLVCNLRGGEKYRSAKCEPLLKGLHSNDASNVTADVISLNGASAGSTSSRHRLQPRWAIRHLHMLLSSQVDFNLSFVSRSFWELQRVRFWCFVFRKCFVRDVRFVNESFFWTGSHEVNGRTGSLIDRTDSGWWRKMHNWSWTSELCRVLPRSLMRYVAWLMVYETKDLAAN